MNVHGINDLRQPDSERRLQNNYQRRQPAQDEVGPWGGLNQATTEEQIKYAEQNNVLFISGSRQLKNPREQTFWDMLIYAFCPNWKCLSITMLLILADTAIFIAEAVYGIEKSGDLLQISIDSLTKFGANSGDLVHQGQVYRLVSAIFAHVTFVHYIGNIFSTFILVTRIEHAIGQIAILLVYLLCGIGGNIFSIAVDSNHYYDVKAGASTALFGMIGVILGYLIINWEGLSQVGEGMRCRIACQFFFLLIFVLIFTPSKQSVDYFGHLGGFLTGIWATGFLTPLINKSREKTIRIIFVVLLIIQFLATFLGFYFSH